MNSTLEAPSTPRHGRDRLIEAALELSDEKRSFTAVGIRELARQAGLSANAFYRHFDSPDQLGLAVVDYVGKILGGALREVRQEVMGSELLVTASVLPTLLATATVLPSRSTLSAITTFAATCMMSSSCTLTATLSIFYFPRFLPGFRNCR